MKVFINIIFVNPSGSLEIKDLIAVVSAIISIIAASIAIRNTNITIKMARLNNIIDSVSLFLAEVDPSKCGWRELKEIKYVTEQHNFLENKISMLLDNSVDEEHNLIDIIKKFKDESIEQERFEELRKQTIFLARVIAANERKSFPLVGKLISRTKQKYQTLRRELPKY